MVGLAARCLKTKEQKRHTCRVFDPIGRILGTL